MIEFKTGDINKSGAMVFVDRSNLLLSELQPGKIKFFKTYDEHGFALKYYIGAAILDLTSAKKCLSEIHKVMYVNNYYSIAFVRLLDDEIEWNALKDHISKIANNAQFKLNSRWEIWE